MWFRLPLALLLAVALLLQGIVEPPPIAAPASDPFWTLGGICGPGHASGDPGAPAQDTQHHRCACCQAGPIAFLLPAPPLALPSSLVVAARLVVAGPAPVLAPLRPPYASRAPPRLG